MMLPFLGKLLKAERNVLGQVICFQLSCDRKFSSFCFSIELWHSQEQRRWLCEGFIEKFSMISVLLEISTQGKLFVGHAYVPPGLL